MLKNRKLNLPSLIVAVALFCSAFGGCSGGDNREYVDACENGCPGGDDGAGPAFYRGATNFASIDQSNVQLLVGGALFSGQFSRTMSNRSTTHDSQRPEAGSMPTLRLPLLLSDSARLIDLSYPTYASRQAFGELRSEKGSANGSCGGSFEYSLNINDAMYEFSGSFIYHNYCSPGIAVSGKVGVRGTYDTAGNFHRVDFLFSNLSDGLILMEGEITVEFTDTRIECQLDYYAEDQDTGKVCWINQYRLNIYESSAQIEFEFHGNYYDPDYGYVLVFTTENFQIFDDDKWPVSGGLLIHGQDNATAELIAVDNSNCIIMGDLDGDELLDFDSGILNWEDLHLNFGAAHIVHAPDITSAAL